MSLSVSWAMTATITETLPNNTGSAADANRVVTHTNYNESGTLNGATSPVVDDQASFLATLSTGALTINLAALTGTNGATVDLTGKKVQMVRVKNLGANDLTIKEGASNGHNFFTATDGTIVRAGGVAMFYYPEGTEDVASGARTWDLSGTGSQTSEWTIIAG